MDGRSDIENGRSPDIRERKDDSLRERLRYWGDFIKSVGMPSIFMLLVLTYIGGVVIGYWSSPVLSSSRAEELFLMQSKLQTKVIENQGIIVTEQVKMATAMEKVALAISQHEVQVQALRDISVTLKELRCDVGPKAQREACLREVIKLWR